MNVTHGHAGRLDEESDNTVDQGAGGRVVIQRHEGVHLEFGRAQHALDHDQAEGLENDTAALVCGALVSNLSVSQERAAVIGSHAQTKPIKLNLISPKEAMTTPRTMMPTFPSTFMLGGAMPKAQVANKVTTALVAYSPQY